MLREDFLPGYDLNATALATALGVSRQSVNELLRERRAVSPEMALRLSRFFGNSAQFWLNALRRRSVGCLIGQVGRAGAYQTCYCCLSDKKFTVITQPNAKRRLLCFNRCCGKISLDSESRPGAQRYR